LSYSILVTTGGHPLPQTTADRDGDHRPFAAVAQPIYPNPRGDARLPYSGGDVVAAIEIIG